TSNDSMYGDGSVTVTMYGGKGDDIYYLYDPKNKAVERPGEGVDTISTWMSYKLPANFENLTVTGDKRYAFGNELNNIITGGSGQQTLDGLRGDDVLKGGSGADIFVVNPGNGSDLILDFGATDTVRVGSYGFTSFEEVRANMVQSGANVRLNLSDGEFLVFANK
ncbi:MAG: calcium-binding protein, partial [Mesorhizobium sp.]